MIKQTLISAATAGLIAAGSLAATTAPASASGPVHGGFFIAGPGFSFGFQAPHHRVRPHKVCKAVFKRVPYWKHGRRHTRLVKAGVRCHWVYPPRGHYPHAGPAFRFSW
jgi:hypothetical protein